MNSGRQASRKLNPLLPYWRPSGAIPPAGESHLTCEPFWRYYSTADKGTVSWTLGRKYLHLFRSRILHNHTWPVLS